MLATQMSKYGSSTFMTSPWITCKCAVYGVLCTRRCSSNTWTEGTRGLPPQLALLLLQQHLGMQAAHVSKAETR